jgi:diguanylate cyclase (GGDEF)-like protein
MNSPLRPVNCPEVRLGDDALARLLLRYRVGQSEQAAVRAFGRIVDVAALSATLLQRLNLEEPAGDGAIEPILRHFCRELAMLPAWDFSPAWPGRLMASWADCYQAGAVVEFPFIAIENLVELCQERLFGERDMVYRLEMDILSSVVRLGWCLGGMLSEVSVEREHSFRVFAEDGDPVLGIPNRRHFLALLDQHFSADGAPSLGLIVVQVDWGRAVNMLPMDERDGLRLAFTDAIAEALRGDDILCALGDEEWAVIMPRLRSSAQVSLAGHKLVEACEILLSNTFPALNGRFSAGGAWAPEHADEALALEQAARSALVVAKMSDRLFDVYCADVGQQAQADADMESEVLQAFEACEFELFLQPQVALPSRRPVAAEALLRWRRADGSSVGPELILAVMGRLGLLPALSRWVIQRAVQALAALDAAGCPARISVNLGVDDLKDAELPLFVRQTCETWRVPTARLSFEVTESALPPNDMLVAGSLARLKDLGGRVALDDFGTGFASMDYLRRMPVHELKVDASFVSRLVDQDADRAIVELMVRVAHGFGLQVVAEGVESARSEDILVTLGCDCAQGYLYAEAMPVDAFVAWWLTQLGAS